MSILKNDGKLALKVLFWGLIAIVSALSLVTFFVQLLYVGNSFTGAIAEAGTAFLISGLACLWPPLFLFFLISVCGIEFPFPGNGFSRTESIFIGSGCGPALVFSIMVLVQSFNSEGVTGEDSLLGVLGMVALALPCWAVILLVLNYIFLRSR